MASLNVVRKLIEFHFIDVPKKIIHVWKNYLWFSLYFFSFKNIILTFFSPWKRIVWAYPRGFNLGAIIEVLISNLFSRILGAIVRSVFVIFALISELVLLFLGAFLLFSWLFFPFFWFFLFLKPSIVFSFFDFLKEYFY